jgi:hypothetical protein
MESESVGVGHSPQGFGSEVAVHQPHLVQGLEPARPVGEQQGQASIIVGQAVATLEPVPPRSDSFQRPIRRKAKGDVKLRTIADRFEDAGAKVRVVEQCDFSRLAKKLVAHSRVARGLPIEHS